MKNIHLLPTNKPSSLVLETTNNNLFITTTEDFGTTIMKYQNIYITSDVNIKEGDYWIYICHINGLDYGDDNNPIVKNNLPHTWFEKLHDKENYKKIILTTDQELIADGVQAIDEDFLEWFVKNPSCEEVEMTYENDTDLYGCDFNYYKIIIPNVPLVKEPRQEVGNSVQVETLEEAAKRLFPDSNIQKRIFIKGAKWQQDRMYSEEEVEQMAKDAYTMGRNNLLIGDFNKWFEQTKKK